MWTIANPRANGKVTGGYVMPPPQLYGGLTFVYYLLRLFLFCGCLFVACECCLVDVAWWMLLCWFGVARQISDHHWYERIGFQSNYFWAREATAETHGEDREWVLPRTNLENIHRQCPDVVFNGVEHCEKFFDGTIGGENQYFEIQLLRGIGSIDSKRKYTQ